MQHLFSFLSLFLLATIAVEAFLPPPSVSSSYSPLSLTLPSSTTPPLSVIKAEKNEGLTEVSVAKTNSDPADSLHTVTGTLLAKDLKNVFVEAQKDIAKRQTYPGFRPGTIPPFAQKPIKDFAIRIAIEDGVQRALQMENLEIEDENIDIKEPEDIEKLVANYNFKEDITYKVDAKAKAKEGTDQSEPTGNDSVNEDDVIDVEAK